MKKLLVVLVLGMTMFSCSKEEIKDDSINEICGGFYSSSVMGSAPSTYAITVETEYGLYEVTVSYSVYLEYKDTETFLEYICLPITD